MNLMMKESKVSIGMLTIPGLCQTEMYPLKLNCSYQTVTITEKLIVALKRHAPKRLGHLTYVIWHDKNMFLISTLQLRCLDSKTTTFTKVFKTKLVHAHEQVSFWQENVTAVAILLQVLVRMLWF